MLSIFFTAFSLGLIFSIAPGPILAESLRQGIHGGFRSALLVQLGSLVGDATWAILGLLGVGLLFQIEFLRMPLGLLGAGYLLYLALTSWRSAKQEIYIDTHANSSHALRSGVCLSITNPQNFAYWAAIGSALGALGITDPSLKHYLIYFSGFMLSSFIWCFICAFLVKILVRNLNVAWSRISYKLCALLFFLLALGAVRELLHPAPNKGTNMLQHQLPIHLKTSTAHQEPLNSVNNSRLFHA